MTSKDPSYLFKIAGFSGAVAVMLGALGAHALKGLLSPDLLASFETGVRYHLMHSILLLVLAIMVKSEMLNTHRLVLASNLLIAGMLLFSGSIYLLSTRHLMNADFLKILGPITPIGGILLISSWCLIALSFRSTK
ncbi:MAG: DUF423 domain-containing protein [Bacteroidota bacterium]